MPYPSDRPYAPIGVVRAASGEITEVVSDDRIRAEFVVDDAGTASGHISPGYLRFSDGRVLWWEPGEDSATDGIYQFYQDDVVYPAGETSSVYVFIIWDPVNLRWIKFESRYPANQPGVGAVAIGWGPVYARVAIVTITVDAERDPEDELYHATIDAVTDDRLAL